MSFRKSGTSIYLEKRRDAQHVFTRCSWCPWRFRGRADEARVAFKEHLRVEHPERVPVRRRRRPGKYVRQAA
jgi:hypothetical protein